MLGLLISVASAQDQARPDVVESFLPSSVQMFAKTSRIKGLIDSVNSFMNTYLTPELRGKILQSRDEFKNKTGLDLLNADSLRNSGIDVNRTLAFAMYKKKGDTGERMAITIPVVNEKTFPLKFVEIIKKSAKEGEGAESAPVISKIGEYTVYQIKKDMFTTVIDGTFVLASTEDLLKDIISTRASDRNALVHDPFYQEYQKSFNSFQDIRVFLGKDMLKEIFSGKTPVASDGQSVFNTVDFACFGASIQPSKLGASLGARIGTDRDAQLVLSMLKTGEGPRALNVRDVTAYSFLCADLSKLEDLCKKEGTFCKEYSKIKRELLEKNGIDLAGDIIPRFTGMMNGFIGKIESLQSTEFASYFPTKNKGDAVYVWKKVKAHMKSKLTEQGMFGEEKIAGVDAFWFMNNSYKKQYVLASKKGIFMGTTPALIASAMKAGEIGRNTDSPVLKKITDDTFLYVYMSRESLSSIFAMLGAFGLKEAQSLMDRVGNIYMVGKKRDRFILLDLEMGLIRR